MKQVLRAVRWLFVLVGVVALTSFTIDATDTMRSSNTALSSLVGGWSESRCPAGTTELALADTVYCIDTYENSAGANCPHPNPQTELDTKANLDAADCQAESNAEQTAWTGVTYHQAKSLCAKRGMRLPTANEWFEAALGTPADERCNIASGGVQTDGLQECVSYRGTYNMVGNVWEWIDGTVEDGIYNERTLPAEGYVSDSTADGIASETSNQPSTLYDNGYFWHSKEGSYVIMRGGFYGSGEDASIYTTHTKVAAGFHSGAIGFRCIREKE